jgi:hypothetical protein
MLPFAALWLLVPAQLPPLPPLPPSPPGAIAPLPPPPAPAPIETEPFVVLRDGQTIVVNARRSEVDHLRELHGDVLWFERKGQAWLVRDAAEIAKVAKLFEAPLAVVHEQVALASQQADLAARQAELASRNGRDEETRAADEEKLARDQEALSRRQQQLSDAQQRHADEDRKKLDAELDELVRSGKATPAK